MDLKQCPVPSAVHKIEAMLLPQQEAVAVPGFLAPAVVAPGSKKQTAALCTIADCSRSPLSDCQRDHNEQKNGYPYFIKADGRCWKRRGRRFVFDSGFCDRQI